jgi:hypothetical protein
MMRLIGTVVVLILAPAAFGDLLNEDLNSTNPDVIISDIDGFVVDELLGVEVAQKFGQDWVWPAITIEFAAVDLTVATDPELQINARIYREVGTYEDCHNWGLIYDADGTEWDLGWIPENRSGDYWEVDTWLLGPLPGGDFDATQVTRVLVRSTNWGGEGPPDFYRFENITITPEPASLSLLALGGLALLRRR